MRRPTRVSAEALVSRAVREKLRVKHRLELWDVEQALFDDPGRFALRAGDLYAVYGRTFVGRYLLCLVRRLRPEEVPESERGQPVLYLRLVTAREMDDAQRRRYQARRGG